jgi:exodeoxyribonuclease-3
LRIDHLLLSPSVTGRLVRAEVDSGMRGWEKVSNQVPTWIELAAATKPAATRRRAAPVENRK